MICRQALFDFAVVGSHAEGLARECMLRIVDYGPRDPKVFQKRNDRGPRDSKKEMVGAVGSPRDSKKEWWGP